MSCYSKENLSRNDYNNVCKSHSARSDREIYRVCPSKLSKRELEDLYFSLLENNLELKRTVNGQHDKIKGLSTKVQRMATAQRLLQSKEFKDCCVGSKFVINEQRDSITELRRANQKLSDKVQQLNMRLCSAKQFHRRAPSQSSNSRCLRCATVTTGAPTIKRFSNADKASESIQCDNNLLSGRSAQTEEPDPNKGPCEGCDENRCKTVMEELKMKIVNLQEELSMVHEDYSARLAKLESEVSEVRRENVRVAGERTASLHQLQTSMQKTGEVMADYRTAEARCAELEALLAIERRRVAELETQLKAANMSDKVNKAIEDHLTNINETNGTTKAAPNGTTRNSINGVANFTSRATNGTTKSTFKSITKVTTNKSTSNGNIKTATSKTASYAASKSTTKSTTKSTPRSIPEAAILSTTPQAIPNATTDTTTKGSGDNTTDTTNAIDENILATVTINENDPKNATTDDNIRANVTQTTDDNIPIKTTTDDNVPMNAPIEDNIPANATKTAATNDNIRMNATTEDNIAVNATIVTTEDNILANTTTTITTVNSIPMKATTDDNVPYNATTDDNIPTNGTKTAVTDGTSSPTRDVQGITENASQSICKCTKIKLEMLTKLQKLQPLNCECPYQTRVGDDSQYASSKTGLSKSKSSQSKINKVDKHAKSSRKTSDTRLIDCKCTSHHALEQDISSASSTSPTKGDTPATKYALCACQPPQDTSTPNKKNKSVSCRCKAWQKAMEIFEEDSRCKKCCYKELDVRVIESIAKNVVPTASPITPADEATAKASDDSGYLESNRSQDNEELAVHKLNKQLLAKVQELQKEVELLRSAQVSNMAEVKKKLGETYPTPRTANDMSDLIRPERPARVETVDKERQEPLSTINQMLEDLDDGRTKSTINLHSTDTLEKASTSKPDRYPPPADTRLLEHNANVVPQYKPNTTEPAHGATDSTQTRSDGKLKVLKSTPLVLTSSLENVHTGLNKAEMVPDKPKTTQATDTDEDVPSMMPGQNAFQFTNTEQQGGCKQSELMASDSQTKLDMVPTIDSLASNPEIGVIMHSKLARNTVRERGNAVKLYDGTETEYSNPLKLPMTEALVANQKTSNDANEQAATPELCEQCPACTFDRECAIRRRNTTDSGNSSLGKGIIKQQATKTDQHNSLQIPGPLPTDNQKEKRRSVFRRFSFDKKKDKPKKTSKSSVVDNTSVAQQSTDGALKLPDVAILDLPHGGSSHDRVRLNSFTLSTDPFRRRSSRERRYSTGFKDQGANQDARSLEDPFKDRTMPMAREDHSGDEEERMNEQTQEQASQATNDLQSMLRERAEVSRWRDVSVYRRSSGTLCYRPVPANYDADCHCPGQLGGHCLPRPLDKGLQVEDKVTTRRVSIFSEQGNKDKLSSCVDNSDFELSYLSDLPLEKDGRSPEKGRALSPGEDKTTATTTTCTESYYSPNTNYSLSEGEVPTTTKRVSYQFDKDRRTDPPPPRSEESAAKMEAALRAITEELARCKSLLQQQRPAEGQPQPQKRSTSSVSISLRPGAATQSIGDAYAPKCVFTLHIGTIVLSDEAVLSSRDKTMVLTWKFYDQNVAMTRMRPGRVVLFDFSTEYDIKITDHFLNYMKHEEMPITICEVDKEEQPFATCSLPLRDALLHTNRRADMSLALLAGPRLLPGRDARDALDAGDEMGVIDLWCKLRAEAPLLPSINRAIAQQPSSPVVNQTGPARNSRVMPQILDEDHYNEYDLSIENTQVAVPTAPQQVQKDLVTDDYTRTPYNWNLPRSAPAAINDGKQELAFDPSIYPPMRKRRLSVASTSTNTTTGMGQPEHDSGILINEVHTKIKSHEDMRQVLEKSYDLGGTTKSEDDASKATSSFGSLKSTAKLHRRSSRYPHTRENQPAVLQNIGQNIKAMDAKTDTSDLEIYKKYENIGKLIGPNRNEASKKTVKISPRYTDAGIEEPQREEEYREEEVVRGGQRLDITVLWLALNEECEAMVDPHVQRVFVAYTFLGRTGADLETPVSLPKPKHYVDKCYFNFKKTFELEDADLVKLSHMARCRAASRMSQDEKDCIIFSVVSEPAEDPLGLESCEDIGYAYLYLGDLLAYSAGSAGYTEVVPVRAARGPAAVCGVLAVRLDGLHVVRRCLLLPAPHDDRS